METTHPSLTLSQRIRMACHTNEHQAGSAVLFALLTFAACLRSGSPWWLCAACLVFWPALAFSANLFHPLPQD